MGNQERIDPESVYTILTTLRLNKFLKGLLEKTGFNEHVISHRSHLFGQSHFSLV